MFGLTDCSLRGPPRRRGSSSTRSERTTVSNLLRQKVGLGERSSKAELSAQVHPNKPTPLTPPLNAKP
jgi:hypothetical protein